MTRPTTPDYAIGDGQTTGGNPLEYESELAKYKAISDFIERCGELSDVTDTFHHYDSRWQAITAAGLARPYRLKMYRHYKKNGLNHLRMAVNEIVRLLSQPKIILHGSDLIRDDTKEPGFFQSMINGGKKILGLQVDEPRSSVQQSGGPVNGRY